MIKLFVALAVAAVATSPTAADDKADVMVTINQFVDGFNKGDTKAAAGLRRADLDHRRVCPARVARDRGLPDLDEGLRYRREEECDHRRRGDARQAEAPRYRWQSTPTW